MLPRNQRAVPNGFNQELLSLQRTSSYNPLHVGTAIVGGFLALWLVSTTVLAHEPEKRHEPPAFQLLRAEEDYSYLKDRDSHLYETDAFDVMKYIPLNQQGDIYLTLGGGFRSRMEYFSNREWEADGDESFYSQRLSLHSSVWLAPNIRVFGELYHGYTSHEKEFTQFDELDWHQGFVELKLPLQPTEYASFRFGRQEMTFGATRLIGVREGPNIRRTFDASRAIYKIGENSVQAFYGREVHPNFFVFDNDFVLFDFNDTSSELWGLYSQFSIDGDIGNTELYYLGFQSDLSRFKDVVGAEIRHTIGLRRFGAIGQSWHYNTELIYQFGELAGQDIRAYNIETDWHYVLIHTRWQPSIGLKFELTSGDNRAGDDRVNSFNPMFVNPAYYSLAATITPVNIISIHPSLTLHPTKKLIVYIEGAMFWRESRNDGLYRPPRFSARDGNGSRKRKIGDQLGMKLQYAISRHWSFDLDFSYFIAGGFLEETGEAENILHLAPTLNFKF